MTSRWTNLPLLNPVWLNEPTAADFNVQAGELTISAPAKSDWNIDAMSGDHVDSAPALIGEIDGDFSLSARVTVGFRGTYDAGVLCVRQSPMSWAKLCFEYSSDGLPMVVSVVTNGYSDDVNSVLVEGTVIYLRILRLGAAYAFHYSSDGRLWHFVRQFRLFNDAHAQVGFLAQSPVGDGCTAVFSGTRTSTSPPTDVRNGH